MSFWLVPMYPSSILFTSESEKCAWMPPIIDDQPSETKRFLGSTSDVPIFVNDEYRLYKAFWYKAY